MKASYSWLKDHLPLDLAARDLVPHFGQLGFEVAGLETKGPGFTGVVAAEVLEVAKHPNADRLSLCTLTDGRDRLSVVCGAKNVAAGQKVPLARIGAKLPGGREITPAKIRGVESQGMICSAPELGLSGNGEGIMVMDPQTLVGSDIASLLGGSDDVFDLEITPNRPDCLSHLGLARELSAYFRRPLKPRTAPRLPPAEGASLPVDLEAPQACPRYLGRVIRDLEVRPSPAWLASRLESVGLRPINAIVDVTNYILLDMGQPLHAFDLDRLHGGKVAVRFARAGERLKALDGKDYALTPECLVIADGKGPVAVAGVMGGVESAVTDKTKSVFLESAHFAPPVVRRTSQVLRLRSDSSYRFERGTDVAALEAASERATALLLELCGPKAQSSVPQEAGKRGRDLPAIVVSSARVNEILGASFPEDLVASVLKAIGSVTGGADAMRFTPPSWRWDLETPWDLAEETARLLGYDSIKAKASAVPLKPSRALPSESLAGRCRRRLAALGLFEAYNYDFVSEKSLTQCRLKDAGWARLDNPLSEDWTVLRPTLLPGLLQNARYNLSRGARSVRLFELGRVYSRSGEGLAEASRLSGLVLGSAAETFWQPGRTAETGFYDLKGVVAELLSGLPGITWAAPTKQDAGLHPADPLFQSGTVLRFGGAKGPVGTLGLLHPQAARAWDLDRQPVGLFELCLDALLEQGVTETHFTPYSSLPTSWRDLSVVLSKDASYASVEDAISALAIGELKSLELVDVFEGKGIPEGKRSLTMRFFFGRDDRTLTDAEVTALMDRVLAALKSGLGAVLRS